MHRIGRDRLLVVEELGDLEYWTGALVSPEDIRIGPRMAAIARSERGYGGVVVAGARSKLRVCRQQPDRISGAIRSDRHPRVRAAVIRSARERVENGSRHARGERQADLAPGGAAVGTDAGNQSLCA